MNKKIMALSLIAIMAIGITACGIKKEITKPINPETPKESDVDITSSKPIENIEGIENLSEKQWEMISNEENINFSPISLKYAMLLAQMAANDEESARIGTFLGEPDIAVALEKNKTIMNSLEKTDVVAIANGVFTADDLEIKKDYIKKANNYLRAEAKSVNFENGEAQKKIDKWVSKNTNNLIKNFPITQDVRTLLINAIYFKDKWDYFDEDATYKQNFNSIKGVQSVDMMHCAIENSNLIFGEGYVALKLNMEKSNITIYLPDDGKQLTDIAEALKNPSEKNDTYDKIYVSLPKFKFKGEMPLNDFIIDAGLGEIFDDNIGMFCNLTEVEDLKVSSILQKSTIELNEKGVEASAVTGVSFDTCAIDVEPEKTFNFTVDRPFLYSVESNNEILFIGGVVEIPVE